MNSATHQARHQFAGALQSALSLAEVRQAFLAAASVVVPADAFGLYRFDDGSPSPIDVVANADTAFLAEYEEYGRANDPVLEFVLDQRRPIDSSRATVPQRWEASGARAALGRCSLDHSLEAPVIASGALIGTINFARNRKHPGFSATELVSARIASEQLGLAIERALRFENTGRQTSILERTLDRLPHGVIVTDLDAQVLFRNRMARNRSMASGDPSDVVANSVSEALHRFSEGLRVHTASLKDPLSGNHLVVKSYALGEAHHAAVTLVYDCGEPESGKRLPAWHVLTAREQEIAQLVSEGLTTKQIAERAYITENTVKQHLKRVFAKTDVRNRAELVQLIWASGEDPAAPASA